MSSQNSLDSSLKNLCLIDRLEKTSSIWTRPELGRVDCNNILKPFTKGIFIVRLGSDQKTMILTYKANQKIQHIQIQGNIKYGFHLDGSPNIFLTTIILIEHYMRYSLEENDNLTLVLPRALNEVKSVLLLRYFESLKKEFWKPSIANKNPRDIYVENIENYSQLQINPPTLLPYTNNKVRDLKINHPCDDFKESSKIIKGHNNNKASLEIESIYEQPISINKNTILDDSMNINNKMTESNSNYILTEKICNEKTIASEDNWRDRDVYIDINISKENNQENNIERNKNYQFSLNINQEDGQSNSTQSNITNENYIYCQMSYKQTTKLNYNRISGSESNNSLVNPGYLLYDIIAYYYPNIINCNNINSDSRSIISYIKKLKSNNYEDSCSENINSYENISNNQFDLISEDEYMLEEEINDNCDRDCCGDNYLYIDMETTQETYTNRFSEQLIVSSDSSNVSITETRSSYCKSIRKYLSQICSKKGSSEISQSIRMFIQCTMESTEICPYNTMRLIRQYMSGLKNFIKQKKFESSFLAIIEEERRKTPKNILINLDAIIESILTKSVLKPLTKYVYHLLVHEHYQKNNFNLLASGIKNLQKIEYDLLGLKVASVEIIEENLEFINKQLEIISKEYSPKIKAINLKSLIKTVHEIAPLINSNISPEFSTQNSVSRNLVAIWIYILTRRNVQALTVQSEIEYIEGLTFLSPMLNKFELTSLMVAIESIKVLSLPGMNFHDVFYLENGKLNLVKDLLYFNKTDISIQLIIGIGLMKIIIFDDRINRIYHLIFPVRPTENAFNLCESIGQYLGILDHIEFGLYKFFGNENSISQNALIQLSDYEFPLPMKQTNQISSLPLLHFIYKKKNSIYI